MCWLKGSLGCEKRESVRVRKVYSIRKTSMMEGQRPSARFLHLRSLRDQKGSKQLVLQTVGAWRHMQPIKNFHRPNLTMSLPIPMNLPMNLPMDEPTPLSLALALAFAALTLSRQHNTIHYLIFSKDLPKLPRQKGAKAQNNMSRHCEYVPR